MILYIGNKLSKHGYTPTNVETLGPKLQKRYQVVLVSDKKNKILRFLDAVYSIFRYRKQLQLVLIDTYSTINFYYTLVAAWMCQLYRIDYIPILHGGGLPQRLENSPKLSNKIFNHSLINVSPSHYLQDAFRKHQYNVAYIPNYIDTAIYPTRHRKQLEPKILYVRSFHEIYNPEMAVKVLDRVIKVYPSASLCMVGPNKDGSREKVEALAAKMGLSEHLKITGKLSKEEWISLSNDYDIFINTTNFDNLPVSIIEAMCLGFPIVSTNAGGLPYLIENNEDGLLVNLDDDKSMAENIIKLLQDNEFASAMSAKAIEKGKSFEWEEIAPAWYKLIESSGVKKTI